MNKLFLILLSFSLIIFIGCSPNSASKASKSVNNPFATKASASGSASSNSKEDTSTSASTGTYEKDLTPRVAATVNNEVITLEDFQRRLHKKLFVMKAKGEVVPGNTKEEKQNYLQDAVMRELVSEKLLLSAAKEQGALPTDQELQEVLNQIKSNFPSEEMFKQTMLSRGLSEENIINFNRVQIIKERLAAKLGSTDKVNQYLLDLEKNAKIKINQTVLTSLIQQEL